MTINKKSTLTLLGGFSTRSELKKVGEFLSIPRTLAGLILSVRLSTLVQQEPLLTLTTVLTWDVSSKELLRQINGSGQIDLSLPMRLNIHL